MQGRLAATLLWRLLLLLLSRLLLLLLLLLKETVMAPCAVRRDADRRTAH